MSSLQIFNCTGALLGQIVGRIFAAAVRAMDRDLA
jgi:hypothetical protein